MTTVVVVIVIVIIIIIIIITAIMLRTLERNIHHDAWQPACRNSTCNSVN
jgi:ABC-type bacteriocin/lantibiotic exporter with double-glycine peptidase domain